MSMLAERKTKQKWSLNPRGKAWSQDFSLSIRTNLVRKCWKKMGWQHGKGLGPNGEGITEHIKVPYKNDSKGMGYKESNDQWTEHETNFTSLLESLSGGVEKPDKVKLNSLEKKSQTSRVRVHYHKFTREIKKEGKPDSNEEKIKNESVFLLNGGSMRDYFKKKLQHFGKTDGFVVGNNGVLKKEDSESESEMRPSFGFGYNQKGVVEEVNNEDLILKNAGNFDDHSSENDKATFVSYINEEVNTNSAKKKSKNKRKVQECNESVLSPKKKSKKSIEETPKKSKVRVEEDVGLSNPAFNPMYTPVTVQKHLLNTIPESISEISQFEDKSPKTITIEAEIYENKSKKNETAGHSDTPKKKKKRSQNFEETVTEVCNSEDRKKSKKKKELVNVFINEVTVEDFEETPKDKHTNIKENPYEVKVKSKKKKNKENTFSIDNPNFNDTLQESIDSSQTEENVYEVKVKKKKKKEERFAIENPNFNVSLENSIESSQHEENPYEVIIKKKKKTKEVNSETEFALENPNFNASADNSIDFSQIEENPSGSVESVTDSFQVEVDSYEVKDKKKKKKKNKETFAIDNPHFDPNDSVEVDTKNNVLEVERKKKKSKKSKEEGGIINPALNLDTSHSESKDDISVEIVESDIMLNVVTTPIITKKKPLNETDSYSIRKVNCVKRTKSVRFSDVTQERIIPNNEDLRNMSEMEIESEFLSTQVVNGNLEDENNSIDEATLENFSCLDNAAFDKQKNNLEENLNSISKTIDTYQAEIENDINEKKLETFEIEDIMVGDVGSPHGENGGYPRAAS
ncbi:hypothetical protein NQ314_011171 [Rhamnusium bicolor]|uniref:G-patch domain-containing protein n=1 Tax=Rhamnusium bicolor TaxID=1586634 RepID=A0AAV8XLK1_9CUCU|nr:hypothetical protein NQ314_011171 [Rhamnusium bicolor]